MINIINISPARSIYDPHKGNANNVKSSLSKKVLLEGVMLVVLNHIWHSWGNPEMDLTLL